MNPFLTILLTKIIIWSYYNIFIFIIFICFFLDDKIQKLFLFHHLHLLLYYFESFEVILFFLYFFLVGFFALLHNLQTLSHCNSYFIHFLIRHEFDYQYPNFIRIFIFLYVFISLTIYLMVYQNFSIDFNFYFWLIFNEIYLHFFIFDVLVQYSEMY